MAPLAAYVKRPSPGAGGVGVGGVGGGTGPSFLLCASDKSRSDSHAARPRESGRSPATRAMTRPYTRCLQGVGARLASVPPLRRAADRDEEPARRLPAVGRRGEAAHHEAAVRRRHRPEARDQC